MIICDAGLSHGHHQRRNEGRERGRTEISIRADASEPLKAKQGEKS